MKNSNIYKGIAIFLIISVFLYITNIDQKKLFNREIEIIEKDHYYGLVSNKYIDKENHNEPTIILSTGKKISLYGQQYDKIEIGDSLSKKLNTTIIEVFKKDKVIQIDQRLYLEHLKNKNKQ